MTITEILQGLEEKRDSLRADLPTALLQESPEALQEEEILRDEFKNECGKVYNKVKDQMADLEAILRTIRDIKADVSHDNKKINSARWDLIHSRKTSNA